MANFVTNLARTVREINRTIKQGNSVAEYYDNPDMEGLSSSMVFSLASYMPRSAVNALTKQQLMDGKLERVIEFQFF